MFAYPKIDLTLEKSPNYHQGWMSKQVAHQVFIRSIFILWFINYTSPHIRSSVS
jgi:hypothetical protein